MSVGGVMSVGAGVLVGAVLGVRAVSAAVGARSAEVAIVATGADTNLSVSAVGVAIVAAGVDAFADLAAGVDALVNSVAAVDAFANSVADNIDESVRHRGTPAAAGEQGRSENAGRVTAARGHEFACEIVKEARGQQIIREHRLGAAAPTLFDDVLQRHPSTGEESDLNGTLELCGQQPAHLTAGLVRPLVARSCRGKDHVITFTQGREAVGENCCQPRVGPESGGKPNVAAGGFGTADCLGEVDMDVIPRREQQRHEDDGTVGRKTGDHLVDVGRLDVHMAEHHLACKPTDAQVRGDFCREHLDEDLTGRR